MTDHSPTKALTAGDQGSASEASSGPHLRIVNGDATDEEIAAIVAVFAALGSAQAPRRRRHPAWGDPARGVRRTLPHGPGGWRASALPR